MNNEFENKDIICKLASNRLNKEELKALENIKATPYMQKTIDLIDGFVKKHKSKDKKVACWLFLMKFFVF